MEGRYLKEFFFFPDVLIMTLLFAISFGFTLLAGTYPYVWIAMIIGMISYATSEYVIHRFLFHLKPPKNPIFLKLLKRLHYDHHVDPNNLHLLFLPVWYSLPLIIITGGIAYLLTTNLVLTNAFGSGIILFLLYYEWTHYVAHRPVQPLSAWGRWVKKLHLWHHFKNEKYWYGVTSPVFDMVMGTYKHEKAVEKSPFVRDLEKVMEAPSER
ncbi:sterol desaturase family protein [Brevibacillus daliensis]|uniref:sterol desaturase family protein n=1 Tax=Brevibacillus daliensis TaxID=2892995 RepID=UPI001E31EB71|nr:sterol desaturase family protein [Brevibacillus daliensis]